MVFLALRKLFIYSLIELELIYNVVFQVYSEVIYL